MTATFKPRYMELLLKGDKEGASELLSTALASGRTAAALYIDLLMGCQRELGEMWRNGRLSIAEEHRATLITLDLMNELRAQMKPRYKLGKRVVVTTAYEDQHLVGARAVADFLWSDGWDVDFLGVNTPSDEVVRFVTVQKADVVAVAVTLKECAPAVKELVAALKQLDPRPKIMVGGAAWLTEEPIAEADVIVNSALAAREEARRLVGLCADQARFEYFLRDCGERIQRMRKARGLSQQELAEKADLDRAYLSALENGRQNVSLAVLWKIAEALDTAIQEVVVGR